MINYAYESLLASSSVEKDYTIQVYNGNTLETTFTDEELYSEEIERYNPLSTDQQLYIGSCEASYIKFKVRNTVPTLKGKKLIISVKPTGNQYTTWLQLGEYYVDTDELAGDRQSREIMAYDVLYKIINADVLKFYREAGLPLSMKDFRDAFFDYFGVEQVEITLCNDSMLITEVEEVADTMSGLDVLSAILSGNGALGVINNEGKFKYITFEDYDIINYQENFEQGSLVYEDYLVQPIATLKFSTNKLEISVGADPQSSSNIYIMEDNFLFYDKLEEDLTPYVENIFNVISVIPTYRPLKAGTLGNPCVEVGDMVTFKTTAGDTIRTFVLEKIEKGLQGLRDNFETQGREYFEYDLNDGSSKIRRLWNNTIEAISEARTYVYAQRNNIPITLTYIRPETIFEIPVATVDETIPVFLATIPIVMSADGEVTFRYFLDGIEINEDDTDTIYLTKGEQFVTLSNYFEMPSNVTKTYSVTAQIAYRESVERKQEAKIISLKDWIDNQSISVQTSGGVTTAEFNYDYVEHPVDTTPPQGTIAKLTARGMIFASGLANERPWDGKLLIVEPADVVNLIDTVIQSASDNVTVGVQVPIGSPITEAISSWGLTEITYGALVDTMYTEMHTDSYRRALENGDIRIAEDGSVRYTEGD